LPAESKLDGEHWAVKETFPVQSPIGPGPHEPSRQHLGEFYQVSEWVGKACELDQVAKKILARS
jgi:hypothetical protein